MLFINPPTHFMVNLPTDKIIWPFFCSFDDRVGREIEFLYFDGYLFKYIYSQSQIHNNSNF